MAKKRVLPKDFFHSMSTASLDELVAVYDDHLLDAYQGGDRAKRTPLFWALTPNGLIEWLVRQGLDVNQPDAQGVSALFAQADASATYPEISQHHPGKVRLLITLGADIHRRSPSAIGGEFTPLHIAAFRGAGAAVETLLEFGAEADAIDGQGHTALERVIARANLRTLDTLAGVVAPLVTAGARITPEMREAIALLGREVRAVEPGSARAHADRRAAAYAPLERLFELDGASRDPAAEPSGKILVPRASWAAQYRTLWNALVPESGQASSVQGEVIRISGRIGNELLEMGGVNWDERYRTMLAQLPTLLALGIPRDDTDLARVRKNSRQLSTGTHTPDSPRTVAELQQAAVAWVSSNTVPIPLSKHRTDSASVRLIIMSPSDIVSDVERTKLRPYLREQGFQGPGPEYQRSVGETLQIVEVQRAKFGEAQGLMYLNGKILLPMLDQVLGRSVPLDVGGRLSSVFLRPNHVDASLDEAITVTQTSDPDDITAAAVRGLEVLLGGMNEMTTTAYAVDYLSRRKLTDYEGVFGWYLYHDQLEEARAFVTGLHEYFGAQPRWEKLADKLDDVAARISPDTPWRTWLSSP